MPRQIATPDRRTRSFRLPLHTDELLDAAAEAESETVNDVVVSVFNEALPLRIESVDPQIREIAVNACISVAASLRGLVKNLAEDGRHLGEAERAIVIRHLFQAAVTRETDRYLGASLGANGAGSYWAITHLDIDELGLTGPVWDFVRSIGPTSPPPTEKQIKEIGEEVAALKARSRSKERHSRLEALNVLLGIASNEHKREWNDVRRQAEASVRKLLTDRDDA